MVLSPTPTWFTQRRGGLVDPSTLTSVAAHGPQTASMSMREMRARSMRCMCRNRPRDMPSPSSERPTLADVTAVRPAGGADRPVVRPRPRPLLVPVPRTSSSPCVCPRRRASRRRHRPGRQHLDVLAVEGRVRLLQEVPAIRRHVDASSHNPRTKSRTAAGSDRNGWWPASISTTLPARPANSRCRSAGVPRSWAQTR